jgi:glutamate racemase
MKKILLVILTFSCALYSNAQSKANALPIGIFDSGTGGLTVMEAILRLDQFNNNTGQPGADGKPDFGGESYQYLADQANMPYGNYAAEHKTDLLKEHILKNMGFFLSPCYVTKNDRDWQQQKKSPVKMIVIACNTATAYALDDIKGFVKKSSKENIQVVGVIEAGSIAALQYQSKNKGTIGVFATAGTVASGGYPRTLNALASSYGLTNLSIVSQGGVGLAESIDRDWNYFVDTATVVRNGYRGPSLRNDAYPIDTSLLRIYQFDNTANRILCEYDANGSCTDLQINDPSNYVKYHLVTLLEKMLHDNLELPLNTLILGCTHYPYLKDTIAQVLHQLYDFHQNGNYRYRKILSENVTLIDPAVETAKAAYKTLYANHLQNSQIEKTASSDRFFISVPNTSLPEVALQPDGWFTYQYKYGRETNKNKQYVQYVPFDNTNISKGTYERFKLVLPYVYSKLVGVLAL